MKISGPVSVHVFKHGDKYIVLWGDIHGDKRKMCQCSNNNKSCILITTFIKQLQDKYDLFIESPWYSTNEKYRLIGKKFVETNVISMMTNTFYDEMYFHGKHSKQSRIHFTDIRREAKIRPLTNVIEKLIAILFNNQNVKDTSFITTLKKYNTTKNIIDFVDELMNDKEHKVRKQLDKLTIIDQKVVMKFHKVMCAELLRTTKSYDKSHYNLFHVQKVDYREDLLNVLDNLLLWLSYLKDLYTICRMLYYLQKTKLVMTYDGNYHTETYLLFFRSYLPQTHLLWSFNENKRCVTLPLNIAHQISPRTLF